MSDQDLFLKKLELLSRQAAIEITTAFEFDSGDTIARGFSDVGFEEYIVLTGNRICSTLSAKVTSLEGPERRRFFKVLSVADLGDVLGRLGCHSIRLTSELGGRWSAHLKDSDNQDFGVNHLATPDLCLASLLVRVLGISEEEKSPLTVSQGESV